jgi:hypothetical protein
VQAYQWNESNMRKAVEETKTAEFIVRAVNAKGRDKHWELVGIGCVKDSRQWKSANAAEREKLLAQGKAFSNKYKNTHDFIAAGRVGVFTSNMFRTIVPRGTVKLGDQVVAKMIPRDQHPFRDCLSAPQSSAFIGIDRIVKHHEGNLLYAQGKFSQNISKDGKPVSGSKPVSNSSSGFKSSFLD